MCMHTQIHMGTKTISIMDDVYEMLARNKGKSESFSDIIRKNLSRKDDLNTVVGLWSDLDEKDFSLINKTIKNLRKSKRNYL